MPGGFVSKSRARVTTPTSPTVLLTALTASRLVATDGAKQLASVALLSAWITGTANQVVVADAAGGLVTLSTPQDMHTGASPTFAGLTLTAPLTVPNGGSGVATVTANGVLYGNGTGSLLVTAQGAANSVLTANAGAPSFSATPTITGLTITGDGTSGGYWRVGSTSAPVNTTAGDLTAVRLSLGNSVAFGAGLAGRVGSVAFTNTNAAAGADAQMFLQNTIAPASNSSTEHRALYFQNLSTAATGITNNIIAGGYFENRIRADGLHTQLVGATGVGFVSDSASPATVQATTVQAFLARIHVRPSGTSATTIGTGIGFDWVDNSTAGLTITTMIGFRATNPAANTSTTLVGFDVADLTRGATDNIGFRSAISSGTGKYHLYLSGTAASYVNGNLGLGVTATTAVLHLKAGTATANTAPLKLEAGTNLTTAEAGAIEFDGAAYYDTHDTTSGRAQRADTHIFRYAADGSALGPTIADVFGATSAFPMAANGIYELSFYVSYLKTTAGTVTWTLTFSGAVTNWIGSYHQSAVGGIGSEAAELSAGLVTQTGTAAFPASATNRTTAVNHRVILHALIECGATPRNVRLSVTSSSGTVTPLRGSYYLARRLSAGNVGTFAA